jgi:calcineurin-like phosphoesterase family protein
MIYLVGDTHFGHKNILTYCPGRGYDTVEAMNEGLVDKWNLTVTDDDEVYHVGDVAFMNQADTMAICRRLKGHKTLILGNHDLKRPDEFWLDCGFEAVHRLGHGKTLPLEEFLLCHYPYKYALSEYDERTYLHHHAPTATTKTLLHGHVHERWQVKGNMVNVGVDVWGGFPVSLDVIRKYIAVGSSTDCVSRLFYGII